jgi:murein DD-endopeptidase MepM/ murein hydrolase activator NlpD
MAVSPDTAAPPCPSYVSGAQESSPVQKTGPLLGGKLLPAGHATTAWGRPTLTPDYKVPFAGSPGQLASHEGVDYVIGSSGPAEVPIRAAADGVVVYVRLGCPQACSGDPQGMFCHNTAARECGAGWGNHVVVAHAGGILTRYAHLKHGSIPPTALVGKNVARGQTIAVMGNSGRSETRHLHFELGTRTQPFDPCATSQSFDLVFDPEQLAYAP